MELIDICVDIANTINGLEFGDIDFEYNSMMAKMNMPHPCDVLRDLFKNVGNKLTADPKKEVPLKDVKEMYDSMKVFNSRYKVGEIKEVLSNLKEYIESREKIK